ncbi:MAG: thioredoxin domain-containing protein [Anaerolineae bacterium]
MTDTPETSPNEMPEPLIPPPAAPAQTVSRHTFNYLIIAIVFFIMGAAIGVVGYDRVSANTTAQVDAAVNRALATAVAAMPRGTTGNTVAAEPTRDPNQRYVVDTEGDPAKGPADAPVTIVEFADFRCGYCRRFLDQTITPLLDTYGESVRFVYRDYPILGSDSVAAAFAGECAAQQDKFWEFHDLMYANQDNLTTEAFTQYATDLGMDVDAFSACLDSDEAAAMVQRDYQAGQTLGVSGTPTFFINGKMLVGAQPYQAFAQMIDAELAQAEGSGEPPA